MFLLSPTTFGPPLNPFFRHVPSPNEAGHVFLIVPPSLAFFLSLKQAWPGTTFLAHSVVAAG